MSRPFPLAFFLVYLRSLSYTIHFIINLQKYIFFRSIFLFGDFFLFFHCSKKHIVSQLVIPPTRKKVTTSELFFLQEVVEKWRKIAAGGRIGIKPAMIRSRPIEKTCPTPQQVKTLIYSRLSNIPFRIEYFTTHRTTIRDFKF